MNHYEILGVDHLAGVGEIRAAYLQRALEVHPDKAGGSKTKFQKLVAAFEVLSDGSLRSAYNKTLASTKVSRSPKSASPIAHQHAAAAQPPFCAGPRVNQPCCGAPAANQSCGGGPVKHPSCSFKSSGTQWPRWRRYRGYCRMRRRASC